MRTVYSRESLVVLGLKWMVILAILLAAAFSVRAEQVNPVGLNVAGSAAGSCPFPDTAGAPTPPTRITQEKSGPLRPFGK